MGGLNLKTCALPRFRTFLLAVAVVMVFSVYALQVLVASSTTILPIIEETTAKPISKDLWPLTGEETTVTPEWMVLNRFPNASMFAEMENSFGVALNSFLANVARDDSRTTCPLYSADGPTKLLAQTRFSKPLGTHTLSHIVGTMPFEFLGRLHEITNGAIFYFGEKLPWVWRQTPVVLSSTFSIENAYGRYVTAFNPRLPLQRTEPSSPDETEFVLPSGTLYNGAQFIEEMPPMYVAMVGNAFVSQGQTYACDKTHITAGGCWFNKHRLPTPHQLKKLRPVNIVIPFCNLLCHNYYHFTHDQLVRLPLVYKVLLEREDAVIAMPSRDPRSFHKQWLVDILKIPESRIILHPVKANVALYPMPNVCYNGSPYSHLLHALRRLVFERLKLSPPSSTTSTDKARPLRLLLAERRDLTRMPTNYAKLKQQLIKDYKGILETTEAPDKVHVSEQVRAFYDADIVLGPHGANLANVMWMRRGTHVIEILSYIHGNMCYHTTTSAINVTYHAIFHNNGKDSRYPLDYSLLKSHIDHAVKMLHSSH